MSKIEKDAFEKLIKYDEIRESYNKEIEELIDKSNLSNKQATKEKLIYKV